MNVSSIALAPNDYRDYLAAMERLYPLPELPEQHTPFLGPWQDDDDMLFADIFSENTPRQGEQVAPTGRAIAHHRTPLGPPCFRPARPCSPRAARAGGWRQ